MFNQTEFVVRNKILFGVLLQTNANTFALLLARALVLHRKALNAVFFSHAVMAFGKFYPTFGSFFCTQQIPMPELSLHRHEYHRWTAYENSKLANVMHAKELSRRFKHEGIIAVSVHPGIVMTNIVRWLPAVSVS